MEPGVCDVLLVEDSFDDAFFINRAWGEGAASYTLAHVSNGEKAKEYLMGLSAPAAEGDARLPLCIISDVKMPYCDGIQLLKWVREQPNLQKIPFVILSSSPLERDIETAYALGANGYFVKPKVLSGYVKVIQELSVYWTADRVPET